MVRTLKNRRRKTFQYDKNRKNLKKKLKGTGKIQCPEIRKGIEKNKALAKNISEMGIVYDIKKKFKIESFKEKQTKQVKRLANGFIEENQEEVQLPTTKRHVLEQFEKEANAPKVSKFRLPKCQIKEISYFMERYGLNYSLWTKDSKNFNQLTWRQYRAKCRKFMNISEQFGAYLEERNLVESEINADDPKWKEFCSSDED